MLRLLDLVREHRQRRDDGKEGASIQLRDVTDQKRALALATFVARVRATPDMEGDERVRALALAAFIERTKATTDMKGAA